MATQESRLLLIHTASIPLSHPSSYIRAASFKRSLTRVSSVGFFHETVPHGSLSIRLVSFRIFQKIGGDIRNFVFIIIVNDNGDKLLPVSLLLAINYCRCLELKPAIKPSPGFSTQSTYLILKFFCDLLM
jgi:hypothetical protein